MCIQLTDVGCVERGLLAMSVNLLNHMCRKYRGTLYTSHSKSICINLPPPKNGKCKFDMAFSLILSAKLGGIGEDVSVDGQ